MDERPPVLVRTSVVRCQEEWLVRVRVEQGEKKDPLYVGPFPTRADADRHADRIVKFIRKTFGIADA